MGPLVPKLGEEPPSERVASQATRPRPAANNTTNVGEPDEIHFNIAGPGPHTIRPTSELPTITDPVMIDGYTQPGVSR